LGEVNSVKFSDCGNYLCSGGYDKQIFIWDIYHPDCQNVGTLKGHNNAIMDLCWSANSETLYSASADKCGSIWDLHTLTRVRKLKSHTAIVNSIDAVKRGPETIVTGSDDQKVHIWDARAKEPVLSISDGSQVTSVVWGLSNDKVFIGGIDN